VSKRLGRIGFIHLPDQHFSCFRNADAAHFSNGGSGLPDIFGIEPAIDNNSFAYFFQFADIQAISASSFELDLTAS